MNVGVVKEIKDKEFKPVSTYTKDKLKKANLYFQLQISNLLAQLKK